VVVCGRNAALVDQLRQDGITFAFGWVDDMPGLMHACDVLVQNAGGLTSLEAFAAGLPVASYRCIPGHGRTNAEALEEAGLAAWIRCPEELGPVLADLLHGPRGGDQRAAGIALHCSAPGPVPAVAARTGHPSAPQAPPSQGPGGPRGRGQNRRRGRLRLAAAVAAAAVTLTLGVAAPLIDAFGDAPGRLIAVTHYLDGDRS
jgi:hypothetical protein